MKKVVYIHNFLSTCNATYNLSLEMDICVARQTLCSSLGDTISHALSIP